MTQKLKSLKQKERRKLRRSLDPEKYLEICRKYYNNETSWLRQLYGAIKRKSLRKDKNRERKRSLGHYDCYFTYEEFLQAWAAHKKRYNGMYCGYTGVLMTHQRSAMTDPLRNQSSNISVDRIDPERPYTLDNIIFCTVNFNNKKGSIGYKDCLAILQKFIELGKQ